MIHYKNAEDTLDYTQDWSEWLNGDTIVSVEWTVPAGITEVKNEFTSTTTTIWLSGGTAGNAYFLTITITTSLGRIDTRPVEMRILPDQETKLTILTFTEAANVLACEWNDNRMIDLLPLVDDYIEGATGRNWAADDPVANKAKAAARILLTLWYENPAMIGNQGALPHGLTAVLSQLEALAMEMR